MQEMCSVADSILETLDGLDKPPKKDMLEYMRNFFENQDYRATRLCCDLLLLENLTSYEMHLVKWTRDRAISHLVAARMWG